MVKLFDHQQESVEHIAQAFARKRRSVLFVLPTGGGKTTVFSHITQRSVAKGSRIGILVHRKELIRQGSNRLTDMEVSHGIIGTKYSIDLSQRVQVCGVQSLVKRLHILPPDYFDFLIIDEAHHTNASTWAMILKHFNMVKILGVTATPCRSDGSSLGQWYEEMILGKNAKWLTENQYLAPAVYKIPPGHLRPEDLRLGSSMGDYNMKQASGIMQSGQVLGDSISQYRQFLDGETAIMFCCDVAHAEAEAAIFRENGIAAASIDGKMTEYERFSLLDDLKHKKLKVLMSCELIGEGVDIPSVTGVILRRHTKSLAKHLQMIGRGLRYIEGKTAVILDPVGNTAKFGDHLYEHEWSLDGKVSSPDKKELNLKVCPKCFTQNISQASKCRNTDCDHVFNERKERVLERIEGELVDMEEERKRLEVIWRKRQQGAAQTIEELVAVGKERGMRNPYGWAHNVLKARQMRK